jgi:hypothetical protein
VHSSSRRPLWLGYKVARWPVGADVPNAKYVFSKAEYEHRHGPAGKEGAGVYQDSVLPVIESGQAEIIDGQGAVGDRLMPHPTPGANSWPCGHKAPNRVFGGDIMHQPLQVFRPGWNSAFCENPVRARDSRRWLLERAAETLPRVQFAEWAEELVEGATWRCRQCSSGKQCLSENRPRWSRLGWSRKIVTLDHFPPIRPA